MGRTDGVVESTREQVLSSALSPSIVDDMDSSIVSPLMQRLQRQAPIRDTRPEWLKRAQENKLPIKVYR